MDRKIKEKIEEIIEFQHKAKKICLVMPFVFLLLFLGIYKLEIMKRWTLKDVGIIWSLFMATGLYMYYKTCKKIEFLENPQLVEYEGIIIRKKSGKDVKYIDKSTDIEYFGEKIDLDEYVNKEIRGIVEDQSKIFLSIEEMSTEDIIQKYKNC